FVPVGRRGGAQGEVGAGAGVHGGPAVGPRAVPVAGVLDVLPALVDELGEVSRRDDADVALVVARPRVGCGNEVLGRVLRAFVHGAHGRLEEVGGEVGGVLDRALVAVGVDDAVRDVDGSGGAADAAPLRFADDAVLRVDLWRDGLGVEHLHPVGLVQ